MAIGTLEISGLGTSSAPLTYTASGSNSIDLVGVHATFDGSGAGSAFLPCIQILSAAGHVMAQGIGSSVAAGGSADVTFGSFLGSGSGTVTNAVLKDTGNTMDWLGIQTLGPSGNGLVLKDLGNPGDTGLLIEENGDAGMQMLNAGAGQFNIFNQGNGDFLILQTGNGRFLIESDSTVAMEIQSTASDLVITPNGGQLILNVTAFNLLVALGIPNASPGVSGAIWKDGGGVLHIDP